VEDLGAVVLGDRRGIVIGVVVNNDEFVDELLVMAYRFEYRADGVRFVLRGITTATEVFALSITTLPRSNWSRSSVQGASEAVIIQRLGRPARVRT